MTKRTETEEIIQPPYLNFFLPMIPPTVTSQQHRFVSRHGRRIAVYDPPALKDARMKFIAYLSRYVPPAPYTGPIRLSTTWCFPANRYHPDGTFKTTRPDTDNLIKLFKDCMTWCGFWKDDAQIASEQTVKYYANEPGIFVHVEPMLPALLDEMVRMSEVERELLEEDRRHCSSDEDQLPGQLSVFESGDPDD